MKCEKNAEIKHNRKYLILCVLIVVFCFMPVMLDLAYGRHPYTYAIGTIAGTIEMKSKNESPYVSPADTLISQSFVCNLYNVLEIELKGKCEGTGLSGKIGISLYDDEKEEKLESWEVPINEMKKEGKIKVSISRPEKYGNLRNRRFRIYITAIDLAEGENVFLSYLPYDWYEKGSLCAHGTEMEGDLIMGVTGCKDPADMMLAKSFICLYAALFAEWLIYRIYHRYGKMKAGREQVINGKA